MSRLFLFRQPAGRGAGTTIAIITAITAITITIVAITPIRAIGRIGITIGTMIVMTTVPTAGIIAATIGTIIIAGMITLTQAIARIGLGTDSLPNRNIRLLPFFSSTLQMLLSSLSA